MIVSRSSYLIIGKGHTKCASAPQERPFPFLLLPPELRNRIYEFALVPSSYVCITALRSVNSKKPDLGVHLLRACRQINKEGADVLYSKTNFYFRSFRWGLAFDTFTLSQALGRLGSDTVRLIRHFTLTVRVHHGNDRLRTTIEPNVDWNGIQHMTNLKFLQIFIGAHPAIMKVWNSRPQSSSILHGIIANTVAATPKSVALGYSDLTRQKSEADEAAYHQSLQTKGKNPDPLLLGMDDKAVWYLHVEVFADVAEQYRPLRGSKWDKPAVTWSEKIAEMQASGKVATRIRPVTHSLQASPATDMDADSVNFTSGRQQVQSAPSTSFKLQKIPILYPTSPISHCNTIHNPTDCALAFK